MAISSSLSGPLQNVAGYAASYAWGPLVGLSRTAVASVLSRIQCGQLMVVDHDGRTTTYGGDKVAEPTLQKDDSLSRVELVVHKEIFWVRMLLFADMVRPLNTVYC